MAGNSPSGSAPDRVNSSVWQTPVAYHHHFALARSFELNGGDLQRLSGFEGDGGANFHGGSLFSFSLCGG